MNDFQKNLEKIDKVLDVDRTNEIFESSIDRSDAHSKEKFNDNSLKSFRAVISAGNLHKNTAVAKVSVNRLIGYRKEINNTHGNIKKKLKNATR